jgi:putative methionine-R-sulfoxide reductase with GAF domain
MKNRASTPRPSRSLTTILALSFLGLSALVLILSTATQLALTAQAQQRELEERQLLIAENAGASVSDFIEKKFSALTIATSLSAPVEASASEQASLLDGLLGLEPAFRQIALLDRQGQLLESTSRVAITLSSQFEGQIKQGAAALSQSSDRYLSEVYVDEDTIEPLIALAIPIKTTSGSIEGFLVAEVNLKFIWDLVGSLRVGDTGYAYVADSHGDLIAYRDTSAVLQGLNVSNIGNLSEFVKDPAATFNRTAGIQQYVGLNGQTVVGAYIPLPSLQWAVVIELPWREAYQDVFALGIRSLALFLVIAILAGLFGYFSARRASAPLIDLSRVATEIANGNLHAQAKETGATELAQLASSFNHMTAQLRDSIANLEQRVVDRTNALAASHLESEKRAKDLLAISEVSRIINIEKNIDILLPLITRLVSEKFGFYHVGIFLLDDAKQTAILQAANSEGGQRMLLRGHALTVGHGIVGNVALEGKSRIALDVGADASFFNNPDLPSTRSEMALPMKIREQVIGVLDVQSQNRGEFTEDDLNILGILASQVSVAIENARLFAKTEQALAEVQGLYNQYIQKEWKNLRARPGDLGYKQTPTGGAPLKTPLEFPELQTPTSAGKLQVREAGGAGKNRPSLRPSTCAGRSSAR